MTAARTFRRDPRGRVATIEFPDGSTAQVLRDARGRVAGIEGGDPALGKLLSALVALERSVDVLELSDAELTDRLAALEAAERSGAAAIVDRLDQMQGWRRLNDRIEINTDAAGRAAANLGVGRPITWTDAGTKSMRRLNRKHGRRWSYAWWSDSSGHTVAFRADLPASSVAGAIRHALARLSQSDRFDLKRAEQHEHLRRDLRNDAALLAAQIARYELVREAGR